MECPNCKESDLVRVNRHGDGYSSTAPLFECGSCALVWREIPNGDSVRIDTVVPARPGR